MGRLEEAIARQLALAKEIVAEGRPAEPTEEQPGDLTKVTLEIMENAELGTWQQRTELALRVISTGLDMLGYHKHLELYESAQREVKRAGPKLQGVKPLVPAPPNYCAVCGQIRAANVHTIGAAGSHAYVPSKYVPLKPPA